LAKLGGLFAKSNGQHAIAKLRIYRRIAKR
jgi:hypothetical protein